MTQAPKDPSADVSREAVALRRAAQAWGEFRWDPGQDESDAEIRRLNARLMHAAMRYAARVLMTDLKKEIAGPDGAGIERAIEHLKPVGLADVLMRLPAFQEAVPEILTAESFGVGDILKRLPDKARKKSRRG